MHTDLLSTYLPAAKMACIKMLVTIEGKSNAILWFLEGAKSTRFYIQIILLHCQKGATPALKMEGEGEGDREGMGVIDEGR